MSGNLRPLIGACILSVASWGAAAQTVDDQASLPWQRSQWFRLQRAYPLQTIPAGARLRALAGLASLQQASAVPAARQPAWQALGPQPIHNELGETAAGRVTALAADPTTAGTVYLGAAEGGVWKTTDGGRHWTPLTDAQPSLATGSIALDPTNPSIVYVGTGEENFAYDSYYGAGILKSTDGGSSWTQFCGPFCGPFGADSQAGGAFIGSLAVDPANDQVLLAGVSLPGDAGIYRSADGGQTWTLVLGGNPGTGVVFDPSGDTAYAALSNIFSGGKTGVFVSTDGGQTWGAASGGGGNALPAEQAGRITLAIAPSSPQTLFASIQNPSSGKFGALLGMFKTTDGGAAWSQLKSTPDYCHPQCWYDNPVAVDPADANVVFAGGTGEFPNSAELVRSTDGGNTWKVLARNFLPLHPDMHAFAFSPDAGTLYIGNDGGAWSMQGVAAKSPTFTQLNSTLAITQFYPGPAADAKTGLVIGGTQDNGILIAAQNLAWTWQNASGDGAYAAIDAKSPNDVFADGAGAEGVWRSVTGGGHWQEKSNGINFGDGANFVPPLVLDSKDPKNLYYGTFRLYQTTNHENSWRPISPDLTEGKKTLGVTTIAVAPSDSNTVYAGTGNSKVWITTNALAASGRTWKKINNGLPPRYVTALAVDPKKPKTAYVAFSGFSGFGDQLGHVFATQNGGGSWADISGNLPNIPVNAIVVNPARPSQLFAGTDIGVFYTDDGGADWNLLGTGLPQVAVLGLTLARSGSVASLFAATHGRGVWEATIPAGL
jgi:photosystem II stability/assembly factor-like uncharacterized protein